jgi:hypothetical protein
MICIAQKTNPGKKKKKRKKKTQRIDQRTYHEIFWLFFGFFRNPHRVFERPYLVR